MAFRHLTPRYLEKLSRVSTHGDERQLARAVAQRWGHPLIEHEECVANYHLEAAWASPLGVLPSRFVHIMDRDNAERVTAAATHASAIFNGLAGDTVFYATLQCLGAIDYAHLHGINRDFLNEIQNSCRLSRESAWLVLRDAVKFGLLKQKRPPVLNDLTTPQLMTRGAIDSVRLENLEHPWVSKSKDLPPGKQYHIEGLVRSGLFYQDVFPREETAATVTPLIAQPVVELCLRIPTYVLLAGGVSRGLARLAFSELLPDAVRKRTVKGFTFAFHRRVVQSNISFIRSRILDGHLVRERILDRQLVANYLVEDQQFLTVPAERILHYLAAEAWLDRWIELQRSLTASRRGCAA